LVECEIIKVKLILDEKKPTHTLAKSYGLAFAYYF